MFIALIREGLLDDSEQVKQVKRQIVIQFGRQENLKTRTHFLPGFDPDRFERNLVDGEDDCVAAVCMGRKATEALLGFSFPIGTIASHYFGVGRGARKISVLTTFSVLELEGTQEEKVNRLNLVKVHLHQLAVAAGLIERS